MQLLSPLGYSYHFLHSKRLQHINALLECYFYEQMSISSINIHPQYQQDTLADLELLLSYRS